MKIGRVNDLACSVVGVLHNRGNALSLHGQRTRMEDDRQIRRRVDELGSHLSPAVGQPTASQRRMELIERVRAREGRPSFSSA